MGQFWRKWCAPTGCQAPYSGHNRPGGTLHFWYKPYATTAGIDGGQQAYIKNLIGGILATIMDVSEDGDAWVERTYDLSAFAGQQVRLEFKTWGAAEGGQGQMYLDDIDWLVPCPTNSPTATLTPTTTPTPVLIGHVTWQGRPPQPDGINQLPIVLTLRMGATVAPYQGVTTDATGFFTVPVTTLPTGVYTWWTKGRSWLATSSSVTLNGAATTRVDMGLQRAGDVSEDNVVDATDFSQLRVAMGKACGDPGYDAWADFMGDCLVDISDFSLLRANFGQAGAAAL